MAKATTDKTLGWLRREGWEPEVVERWVATPHGKGGRPGFHKDLFGVLDVVALKPGELGLLGVQSTSFGHRWDRREKVMKEPRMRTWLMSGCKIWILAWRPKAHKLAAEPDVYKLTLEDFKE